MFAVDSIFSSRYQFKLCGEFSTCGKDKIELYILMITLFFRSALQTLYKVSNKARDCNYFEGGNTHDWVAHYEQRIESDRSCINEWHTMNDIQSRRPPSPDSLRSKYVAYRPAVTGGVRGRCTLPPDLIVILMKSFLIHNLLSFHRPRERLETERVIRSTLKEIMMSVDLDEVTSKYIRSRLEEQLDMDLREFKSFIDQEMLVILGQMDAATEVFPHIYLGSEWNASNLEELNKNQSVLLSGNSW